jgi:integrase
VFKWAESEEMIPAGIHHALMTVSGLKWGRSAAKETESVKPVPDAAVEAIQPYVVRQVWAMIELQRLTGMRPGEVVLMRTGDLDMSGRVWVYSPKQHKTEHHEKARVIPIGPRAQAILEPWLKADPTAFLFSPADARAERFAAMRASRRTKVQPSQMNRRKPGAKRRPGERYTTNTYYVAIRRGCAKACPHPVISKVKRKERTVEHRAQLKEWDREHSWHPNQLRHNVGTQLRKEFGLDTARAVLGHSKANTTEIYAERDQEVAINAIERVG